MLSPFVLESPRVRLEPLAPGHAGPLAAAAVADRSSYQFTWVPDGLADARRYVAAALADQADGRTLAWVVRRPCAGSVLYLVLIGLLGLGCATLVRDAAAAIGVVLGLLYLSPIVAAVISGDATWARRLDRYAPSNAGLAIQDTTGLRHLPIGPWGGLAVLAAWAAAALLAGWRCGGATPEPGRCHGGM